MKFIVSMDGRPQQVRMVARAKNEAISEAALQHIRSAQFPRPPANTSATDRIFTISYIYK